MNRSLFRCEKTGKQGEQRGFADGQLTETTIPTVMNSVKIFHGMHEFTSDDMKKLSGRLRYQLRKARMSQEELAKRCGCSVDTVSRYSSDKCKEEYMDILLLKKMANVFEQENYYFCSEYLKFLDQVNTAEYLRKKRIDRNLSQKQYAEWLGIPLNSYKAYEEGRARLPRKYWEKLMIEEENK